MKAQIERKYSVMPPMVIFTNTNGVITEEKKGLIIKEVETPEVFMNACCSYDQMLRELLKEDKSINYEDPS